ncbi:MAG: hypothetical protein AB9835_07250 [Eubacteriales bacterium]
MPAIILSTGLYSPRRKEYPCRHYVSARSGHGCMPRRNHPPSA